MATHWRLLQPVPSTSTISQNYTGHPIIGPVLGNGKPRVLIGWNHQNDTPEGLMEGQVYCSVNGGGRSGGGRLCIYDSSRNRSENPGEVVFCGLANFTMVRMFHPLWAQAGPNGSIPRDMAYGENDDKANLRRIYHEFLRDHYGTYENGDFIYPIPNPPEPTPSSLFIAQDDDSTAKSAPKKSARKPRVAKPPKQPKQRSKKRPALSSGDDSVMTYPENDMSKRAMRRLAAEDDGTSIKPESRGTSVMDLVTPPPGNSNANQISPVDFSELAAAVEEQASAYPPTDESREPIDSADGYMQDQDHERLLAEWNARVGLQAQGPNDAPASPSFSNGVVEESVEVDEQDAQVQVRESEETFVVDEDDLEMITAEKVGVEEDEEGSGGQGGDEQHDG